MIDMGKVSGMRAVLALRDALDRQGLARTSTMSGAETAGWIAKNHFGSTGFSIRPREDGRLDWHLVISGKPHMRYRYYKDVQGDEVYSLHEPVNPEVVFPEIRAAFASLGIEVGDVRYSGCQTMWDDDVSYNVTTVVPEWLEDWNPQNLETVVPAAPRLLSAQLQSSNRFRLPIKAEIPVYEIGEGRFATTVEGAEQIFTEAAALVSNQWIQYATVEIEDSGNLVIGTDCEKTVIEPVEITNHWGDEVKVYPLPRAMVLPQRRYASQVEVLVAGERIVPGFLTLDTQYGGAPWSEDTAAPQLPRP